MDRAGLADAHERAESGTAGKTRVGGIVGVGDGCVGSNSEAPFVSIAHPYSSFSAVPQSPTSIPCTTAWLSTRTKERLVPRKQLLWAQATFAVYPANLVWLVSSLATTRYPPGGTPSS